jgi:hypothetical protein
MLNEIASPGILRVAESAMPLNPGRLFRQRNKMTVAPKIQMPGHRGVAILRENPSSAPVQRPGPSTRSRQRYQIAAWVNVIQMTLRDGLLDALVQRAFNDHVGTRSGRSANALLVDGWPFSKRCGSAKIDSGIGHAWRVGFSRMQF